MEYKFHSEQSQEIFDALSKAQGELRTAYKNKRGQRSEYADFASLMDTVRPVLSKHGLAVTFLPLINNEVLSMHGFLIHKSGQWIRGMFPIDASSTNATSLMQAYGSANTYAKRYLLGNLTGVVADDEDDDGSTAGKRHMQDDSKNSICIGRDQQEILKKSLDFLQSQPANAKINCEEKLLREYGIVNLNQLLRSDYYTALDNIKRQIDILKAA